MPLFERDPSVAFAAATRGELQLRRLAGAVVGQIGGYADWNSASASMRTGPPVSPLVYSTRLTAQVRGWLRLCMPLSNGSIVFHVLLPDNLKPRLSQRANRHAPSMHLVYMQMWTMSRSDGP